MSKPNKTLSHKSDSIAQSDIITSLIDKQDITQLSISERNDIIFYLYLTKNVKQIDLANYFGVSQSIISRVVRDFKQNDNYRTRVMDIAEKEFSVNCMRKANALVESIDEDKVPQGQKATSAGALYDQTRKVEGKDIVKVAYVDLTRELKDLEAEERELNRQLGIVSN